MYLFGIDLSSFFQPLLALCGALALVLNTRNQDLARLIRSGTEQVTKKENGAFAVDPERRTFLRRQAVIFRERILIVQQGLLVTYIAGICLTLMACFSKVPFALHNTLSQLFGILGVFCVIIACASAIRDIARSVETIELEMVSAYGAEILPQRISLLHRLRLQERRGLWVRLAEGFEAFARAFRETGKADQLASSVTEDNI